ncbi:MAG: 3'-5' exonuclease [Pseudomonadota bacterium]
MPEQLDLRLRIALFFAALGSGGIALLGLGLWFSAQRFGPSIEGYWVAGIVGGLGFCGLCAWVGLLFDENVARPILALAADLSARAAADIGGRAIDEAPARYLGALAPAANAINLALSDARAAQAKAIAAQTRQLQREKHLFEALVRDLTEGVILSTPGLRVMLFNRAASGLLTGLGLDRPLSALVRPDPLQQALDRLKLRHARGETGSETFLTTSTDGSRFLLGHISAIHGPDLPEGHVIILQDATSDLRAHADHDALFGALMEGIRRPASAIGATLEVLRTVPDLDPETHSTFTESQSEELERLTTCLRETEAQYEALSARAWPMVDLAASDLFDAVQARAGTAVTTEPGDDWLRCDPFAVAALLSNLIAHLRTDGDRTNLSLKADLRDRELWIRLGWDGPHVLDGTLQNFLTTPLAEGYGRTSGKDALSAHRTDVWAATDTDRPHLIMPLPAAIAVTRQPPAPWSHFYELDLMDRPASGFAEDLAQTPLDRLTFVVFDTETTGLSPRDGDRIVQIAGVRIVNGRVRPAEVFDTLVNPNRPIPPQSSLVHRITDDMVAQADPMGNVSTRFHTFCQDAVLVAHNAPFDMAFLSHPESGVVENFDHPVLCTVLLSAVVFDASADHSLDGLCARLGISIPETARHSALGDAMATAEAFALLIAMLKEAGVVTLQDAIEAAHRQTRLRRAQSY